MNKSYNFSQNRHNLKTWRLV